MRVFGKSVNKGKYVIEVNALELERFKQIAKENVQIQGEVVESVMTADDVLDQYNRGEISKAGMDKMIRKLRE